MVSNLETLAPLLEVFPLGDSPITPDAEKTIQGIEDALREIAHPDLECAMVGPDPSFITERRGIDGFMEAWADWLSPFERYRIEVENIIESGDHVVTLVRQFGTPRGSTAEVENAGGAVWMFRDGGLARVEFHLDREAALRAAGLAE